MAGAWRRGQAPALRGVAVDLVGRADPGPPWVRCILARRIPPSASQTPPFRQGGYAAPYETVTINLPNKNPSPPIFAGLRNNNDPQPMQKGRQMPSFFLVKLQFIELLLKGCHSEPVRTLAWESPPNLRIFP